MDIRRTGRLRQPTTMWLPLAALFFHQLQMAASDGTVSLKLISYINPKGKGSNNHCCDGKWFWCGSQCDHKFEICLDSAKNVGNCLYGKKNSGEIPNQNRISFGRTVGGLDNPLLFGFESWPGKMMLKFDVWDHDDNADDHVDSLSYIISTSAARSLHQSRAVRINIQHYTTMTAEVRVYCDPGYYGSRCDISCNPAEHPNGHYSCDSENGERICHAGWTGPTCEVGVDDCAGAVCENDGTCVDEHLSSWCDCQPGFVGKLCETEADECASSPCLNNSTCRDLINGFVCACAAGWTGPRCRKNINDCTNHSCRNGATCNDHLNGYTCSCPTGWTGEHCGVNVDECLSSPCQGDATCVDLVGGYSCLCRLGTTGVHCLETVDACVSEPCENGSVCVSSSASGYACICPAGLTGRGCESAVDYCESRPCVNNATCVGLQGGYTCTCAGGWEGANCSIDVDECLHAPCKNGATCNNDAGGYFCACPPGWTGLSCGSEINECEQNRCLNNGSCVNHAGGYRCACVPGYTGDLCEVGVNSCEKRLCKNGARCLDHLNSHTCVCARGWKGKYCDVHLEECLCRNNGTCTNLTGDAECACISTWTGRHCETSLAEKDMEGTVILHQNEGHTRKTVEPEDGRRVSNETPGSSKEVVFYLSGDPDSFRDADLAAALTGLLSEYLEIARKDFKTRVEKITAVDKQHSDIIEVTAYVSRADHGVLPEDIEGFWENISKKKILEWLPHYLENASSLYQAQNLDKPSKQSWWQINWYVLVIAFLVGLFFTCVALYIIYLQRTRKQRDHQPTDDTFASVTALTETAAAATSPPVTATIPLHDIFQPSISPSSCAGARDSEQIFNNQLYTKDHSLPS